MPRRTIRPRLSVATALVAAAALTACGSDGSSSFFQKLAEKYDGRVVFLGVDSRDSRGDAAAFLKRYPVPYPHYYDKDASVARVFRGGRAWPTTAFYDQDGQLVFTHQGAYATEAKLEDEIRRYALDG